MLDDDHLFFADIRSPQTVANIRRGSLVEVNVVDPFVGKGYRFKGPAVVHGRGASLYAEGLQRLREAGSTLVDRVNAIVVIEVREARAVVSPVYDDGIATEAEVIRNFKRASPDSTSRPRADPTARTHRAGSASIAPRRGAEEQTAVSA